MPDVSVLITTIDSSDAAVSRHRLAALQPDEMIRYDRFRRQRDRARFVVGRALLRHGLRELYGIPAAPIGAGPYGKPRLIDSGDSDIDFNLAHSAYLVVGAFARGVNVGIDVEQLDEHVDEVEIAGRHFAAEERQALMSIAPAARQDHFLRLWTLKEAAIKAVGLGLQIPLDGFAFALDPPRLIRAGSELGAIGRWHFEEMRLGQARLALAVQQRSATRPAIGFSRVPLSLL